MARPSSTATPRPDQAAIRIAVSRELPIIQISACTSRPPSSGRPGSTLNTAMTRLLQASSNSSTPTADSAGGSRLTSPAATGQAERDQRAGRGDHELVARPAGLALDLGHPAQQEHHDPAHRQAHHLADHGVAHLVQQHRGGQRGGEQQAQGVGGGVRGAGDLLAQETGIAEGDEPGDQQPARGEEDRHAQHRADPEQPAAGLADPVRLGPRAAHSHDPTRCPDRWRQSCAPGRWRPGRGTPPRISLAR